MTRLRAHFDGKVLVPDEPVDLPTDQPLEVEVRPAEETEPPRGSPQAILKLMDRLPKIPPQWVDDLERAIEEGKLPVRDEGIFDDE